ncbi:hypothetical protein [Gordonia phthalatica]|uniref:Protein kinase n=1 Tax=Gordonia phthalatica TaxID=1136941 RepID=A0A0N7FUF7_9ACTN|nr:hypothetical protein [Gordonia phthalatica]ALG84231.1 hypothetical protein ACH46_06560 [Gordonia phthalatica]
MAYQQGPDHPSMGGPPHQQSPWSSTPVIIAIVAGLLLLIGGVTAALVYSHGKSSSTASSSSPEVPPQSTVTETIHPTTTATPEPTEQPTPTAPTTTDSGSSPVTVPGADRQGFTDGPRCNAAGDDAVFVGVTNRSRVVICQVGTQAGRYYYKGAAGGNDIEIGYPVRSGDTFVATNKGVEYVVSPSSLIIRQNGTVLSQEPMIASWVN